MKYFFATIALCIVMFCKLSATEPKYSQAPFENQVHDGQCFNATNIVELFTNDAGDAFYMVYDDIDAGTEYALVRIPESDYNILQNAKAHDEELDLGYFQALPDDSGFTIVFDFEF